MEEKNSRYGQIIKYAGLFGGVQGLNILVGIVRNKIVTVLLGPDGVGLTALFNSTIKFVGDSTNLGLSMSAVKEISEAYEQQNDEKLSHSVMLIRSWSFLTALLGMLVCMVLSPLLNRWTFQWGDHTLHFVLLSPVVALLSITAGETAVLKGTRKLRQLATVSVYYTILACLISIPVFYIWRSAAIVPSLFLFALIQLLLVIGYSYRAYPLKMNFGRQILGEGMGMVRLGVAFVLAGILGSGAELIIRAFISYIDSPAEVGLYSAGYVMTMTYAGMVFSAMETEYFPRLSAIKGTGPQLNDIVNNQIEVCMLLLSPLLVAFMTFLPVLIPLLYSGKFLPVIGMMQVLVFAMFLRAVTLPISYLPLAKGNSVSYLLMESCYDVAVVVLVIVCYQLKGYTGAGIAIVITMLIELFVLSVYMRWKYGYRLSPTVGKYALMHLPVLFLAYAMTFVETPWLYWTIGIVLTVVSSYLSLRVLQSKTQFWETLRTKFQKKWRK
ncbi:MAG: oligosaccharide flippase family protein [Prevotella sp.]|nr:oligosaccharide flippase family protein [Prevotella sp.]